jgi:hypothetical protein
MTLRAHSFGKSPAALFRRLALLGETDRRSKQQERGCDPSNHIELPALRNTSNEIGGYPLAMRRNARHNWYFSARQHFPFVRNFCGARAWSDAVLNTE